MKIVFLARLFWPHIGGVERHVGELVKELRGSHQITVITELFKTSLLAIESNEGIKVFRIPVIGVGESAKKWVIWRWLMNNQQLLTDADIIHVHDVVFWLYPFKLLHPHKKIFTTFHGWEGVYPLPLKNVIQRKIDATITSRNITAGEYISKWYGISSTSTTYGAVDEIQGVMSKRNNPPKLLYLGRLEENTGWRECVSKFNRLKTKLNWTLTVAGDGPLKYLAPRGAQLLGVVSNPLQYIQSSDYVFTTGYMGILESFASGKVVLSHYENPLKKDYILMHPMAKFITLDDNLPARLPREPQIWAKKQTWEKLANLYLRLWEG